MERSAKWAGLGRARAELRGRWDHDSAAAPSVAGMRARAVPGKRRSLAASGARQTCKPERARKKNAALRFGWHATVAVGAWRSIITPDKVWSRTLRS